jgi:excisionase family DNA binding protein
MTTHPLVPEQELLSLEEAALFLCVSKSTMYRLLEQGKLRGMKAGKQWRFRKDDLLAYMQRGPAALALAKVAMPVLDAELAFFAEELVRCGTTPAACDDPTLDGEAGKLTQLVRRMAWLLSTLKGSDLHLNPMWDTAGAALLLLLRVNGRLREIHRLPSALHEALVLEWKRLAELADDERAQPLGGRAQLTIGNELLSLFVATIPTIFGEKVTARVIPTRVPTLAELQIAQAPFVAWAQKERGLLLFVGPTGSGKSTTRGAFVREILQQRPCNILMVEDPVEYIFPQGVTQLQMARFSPADGMRAVMNHDPDVILLGELHGNPELVQQAVWAAETGHLVIACHHASTALAPLSEVLDSGVKRTMLANVLIGIVYQELAPKLCAACRVPVTPEVSLLARIRQAAAAGGYAVPDDAGFYQMPGCPQCGGRIAVHEILTFTPALRAAFVQSTTMDEFTLAVRTQGQLSFFAAMAQQAVAGAIALDTLQRYLPE